jgi:hypothetical protein
MLIKITEAVRAKALRRPLVPAAITTPTSSGSHSS